MIRYKSNERYDYYKDTSKSDTKNCINIFLGITLFFVGILFVGAVVIPYFDFISYKEHTCYIDRITYPQDLPYKNVSNTINLNNNKKLVIDISRREDKNKNNGWINCNCGNNCNGWVSCIDMYTNISYKKILNNYSDGVSANIDKYNCTYFNNVCVSDKSDLENQLNYSFNIYKNNYKKNIHCFYDKNVTNIYLHNNFNTQFSIYVTLIFILVIVALIYVNIVYCRIEKKEKERQFYQILPNKS
tara:strand:- start:250 stop:981 length:732 start_codon:yes stop_codon:yes gene_type:complete